jgi:beta-N-acetylhexosaminidase
MGSLQEKIGQMFMIGVKGDALSRDEQLIIEEYGFGGFILFSHNCCEPAQILSLCRSLWATGIEQPPFIAIDQEGGRVHRLPPSFTHFPPAALIGRKKNLNLAYRVGKATAAELGLVGINLNFAPVLDVNSNPQNPIIGDRAFAANPASVIEVSQKWIQGLRDGGIIPCGKHFPGHGDTDKNSHLDLPVVDKSLDELRLIELPPFVCACRNQIEALMTAHILYRSLDSKFPVTLSHSIITGLLRHQLGYDGVVFSDDMEMKAISNNYNIDEAVRLGVRAGIDVLLYCHELPRAMEAFDSLCCEAKSDPAVRRQVENSYRRITELKRRYFGGFTGVAEAEEELVARLAKLDHQLIVNEIQGNL